MLLRGEHIRDALKGQHGGAVGGGSSIGGEEPKQRAVQPDAERCHQQRVKEQDAPPLPQAGVHPVRLLGSGVLGDEKDDGLHETVHRHHQQAGELARAGKARDGRDAQPAQKPLFDCRDDGAAGLLQGVGSGKAEDVLRVACLEHLPAEGQTQFGFAQVGQHVPRSGDLCGSGGTGRTGDPEGADERQIQHNVHHAGGDHGPERRFRVSAAHDALFGQVIEHQKGQADQIHPPIKHRLGQDLLRRPDEPEQGGQGEKAQCGQAQRQHKIDEQQVVEQLGHLLPGGRGSARCHQQAAAQLHAAGDEQKEHQDGGSIGDRRQRVGIQPQTDDHGIGHRIELGGYHT